MLPEELKDLKVDGTPTKVGWDVNVLPNETSDSDGNPLPQSRGFGVADESPRLPLKRDPNDPSVQALREHLRQNNGIKGLEMCEPHELDRIQRIFYRDGFVVVKNLLSKDMLERLRVASADILTEILKHQGAGGRKYITESGRLPHRYSYGTASASRHMLHHPVWASLVDLPTIHPIITKLYGSKDYIINGGGGDLNLPGAIEYQHLHRDGHYRGEHLDIRDPRLRRLYQKRVGIAKSMGVIKDPKDREFTEFSLNTQRLICECTPPSGTINFMLVDTTWENGPIRQIPGTHTNVQVPPSPKDEPEWMRLSTCVGAPAGCGIFRDHRAWHGATPNLSDHIRVMPNIEWSAPWAGGAHLSKSMPHEIWETLSDFGKHICRHVKAPPGVWPPGAGVYHPLASKRGEAFQEMGGETSPDSYYVPVKAKL